METFRVHICNVEESERVQSLLFHMGYSWQSGEEEKFAYTTAEVLYAEHDGRISYSTAEYANREFSAGNRYPVKTLEVSGYVLKDVTRAVKTVSVSSGRYTKEQLIKFAEQL